MSLTISLYPSLRIHLSADASILRINSLPVVSRSSWNSISNISLTSHVVALNSALNATQKESDWLKVGEIRVNYALQFVFLHY